jgi:DNA invertase Pin-like site-specific DNA recombinase
LIDHDVPLCLMRFFEACGFRHALYVSISQGSYTETSETPMARKELIKAVAYLRTSSATNVGEVKDSDKRQLAAVEAYATAAGFEIVQTFYDAAVSGADSVDGRPGFAEMLDRLLSNGARTILVESPDRFARDLMVQLAGHDMLKAKGITLIAASAPTFFVEDTPTAVLVRQVLGAVSQFEKAMLVAKLRGARERKKAITGKCGGRQSYAERSPEAVLLAKRLARYPINGRKRSLRDIAAELEAQGHVSRAGTR